LTEGKEKMKHFKCAFESMKETELDSDGKIFHKEPWRMRRIALGAGIKIWEIEELLGQYSNVFWMVYI
jgi:signal recognition particle subunit SRP54